MELHDVGQFRVEERKLKEAGERKIGNLGKVEHAGTMLWLI